MIINDWSLDLMTDKLEIYQSLALTSTLHQMLSMALWSLLCLFYDVALGILDLGTLPRMHICS
jgi:hypothetical protein